MKEEGDTNRLDSHPPEGVGQPLLSHPHHYPNKDEGEGEEERLKRGGGGGGEG